MPKKIKNCFLKNLTFEKLLAAHYRAKKQKTFKNEIILFELNLENNITNILNSIKNNTFKVGTYRSFSVFEPKERIIQSLPYRDRVVHQWYVEEFVKPYILPKFIFGSFACLPDKGTHKAVDYIQHMMQIYKRNYGDFWILKCDIKKFFNSIDPNILLDILSKYINDKMLLNFTKKIIYDSRPADMKIGIPIGNYTSQYFANIYLNELDQYIKRTLKIKYYGRYMDDFILILKTKQECIYYKKLIETFLNENLHLELNSKSRYYPDKMGVNYCGYRSFTTHKLLRITSKRKIKNNVKFWNHLYSYNKLDLFKAMQQINSWRGHSQHCNSYNLQNKIFNNCNFLYPSLKIDNLIEKHLISNIEYNSKKNTN